MTDALGFSQIGTSADPLVKEYGAKPLFNITNGQKVLNTNVPGSASYLQASNLAKLAYGNALTRVNQGRSDILRQYGYAATFDPNNGTVQNLHVDPNNPHGAYQDLLHSGAAASAGAYSEGVSRGIGVGGGLAGQLQHQTQMDFGRGSAQLGTGLSSALFGFQDQQTQAKYEQDRSLYDAERAALMEAIQARQFTIAQAAQPQS